VQFGDRIGIAVVDGAEEFLGLTMELFEVGSERAGDERP